VSRNIFRLCHINLYILLIIILDCWSSILEKLVYVQIILDRTYSMELDSTGVGCYVFVQLTVVLLVLKNRVAYFNLRRRTVRVLKVRMLCGISATEHFIQYFFSV